MTKHVRTEIIINERFKIAHVDALNWQAFEYREIGKPKDASKPSREGEHDWVSLPAFFSCPEHALEWLARKKFADSGEVYESLQDAVKAIKASNRALVRDVAKALESAD